MRQNADMNKQSDAEQLSAGLLALVFPEVIFGGCYRWFSASTAEAAQIAHMLQAVPDPYICVRENGRIRSNQANDPSDICCDFICGGVLLSAPLSGLLIMLEEPAAGQVTGLPDARTLREAYRSITNAETERFGGELTRKVRQSRQEEVSFTFGLYLNGMRGQTAAVGNSVIQLYKLNAEQVLTCIYFEWRRDRDLLAFYGSDGEWTELTPLFIQVLSLHTPRRTLCDAERNMLRKYAQTMLLPALRALYSGNALVCDLLLIH